MTSLANVITLIRICLIPVFLTLVIQSHFIFAAGLIFCCAGLDGLDGYLARRMHQVTKLGMLLDPIADKLLVFSGLIYFTLTGFIPLWFVLALFYRDMSQFFGMMALLYYGKEGIVSAMFIGKLSAGFNFLLLIFLCLSREIPSVFPVARIIFWVTALLVLITFVTYSRRWFGLFRKAL